LFKASIERIKKMKNSSRPQMSEPDQRDIIGYSIADEDERKEWNALIRFIADWIEENDLSNAIVFHGTSSGRAEDIMQNGMNPTDATFATNDADSEGSFWGDVYTAAAYAEDTVQERDGDGRPVLLMAYTDDLEELCELAPDLATMDFPLKGLTRLSDDDVMQKWLAHHTTLSWRDSLTDLGAIVALHEFELDPNCMQRITSRNDFENAVRGLEAASSFGR